MSSGISQYKKLPVCILFFFIFAGNGLSAQKVDATPEVVALCSVDTSTASHWDSRTMRLMEFSPNGDNVHDKVSFKPVNMMSMKVVIFDKDRNILYQSDKLNAEWDGYDLKKQKVKTGTYFFIQTALGLDGKNYEQKGCITLTR